MPSSLRFANWAVLLGVLFFGWRSPAVMADSVVVFNEIQYHPATNEFAGEWVELENQHTVDIDVSGWSLQGGIRYLFPEGTIIPGRGFLVVAASPAAVLTAHPGIQVLGPFAGRLGNSGDHLELRNNSARLMDELSYGATDPWPLAADGTGASLARQRSQTATSDPANWTASREVGGTPGKINFQKPTASVSRREILGSSVVWRFHDGGVDLGEGWRAPSYDDSGWKSGTGSFGVGYADLPGASLTRLQPNRSTYYFRARFTAGPDFEQVQWLLRHWLDDGAVIYLNGEEIQRINLSPGPVSSSSVANTQVGIAEWSEPLGLSVGSLKSGENVLAVELHQSRPGASYAQTVLDSGPVGYWRLGERTTRAVDSSARGGSQDGTYTRILSSNLAQAGPRPTNSLAGRAYLGFESNNAAPRFAGNADGGNDVILIPDSGALSFAESRTFTLEAWVRGASVQEAGAAIIAKGTGGGGEQYAVDVVDGKYRFFVWNGGVPNVPFVVSSSVGPDGSWQHLLAVFDGAAGLMHLWVNGRQAGQTAAPNSLVGTSHEVSIGARQLAQGNYDLNFDGWIDEVAIYDRALSAEEIAGHFEAAFRSPAQPNDLAEDAVFALELATRQVTETLPQLDLRWNEVSAGVSPGSTNEFWVELINPGITVVDLAAYSVVGMGANGRREVALGGIGIAPGEHLWISQETLGFALSPGDRLVLYGAGATQVLDAVVVEERGRGRSPEGRGPWLYPAEPTPGQSNRFTLHSEILIHEIQYHRHPIPTRPAEVTNLLTLPFSHAWRYHTLGRDLGDEWRKPEFDDSAWPSASGVFHAPSNFAAPIPKGTLVPLAFGTTNRLITGYFRTQFEFSGDPTGLVMSLLPVIDDGAIVYLNGQEILRMNLPAGPVAYGTLASSAVGPLVRPGHEIIGDTPLKSGLNTLAVEVHQVTTNSADFAFGLEASVARVIAPATEFTESDEGWVEIYNQSSSAVSLAGWRLSGGIQFDFPSEAMLPAHEYAVIAKDPGLLRASHPQLRLYGPYEGRLSARADLLELRDPLDNPADAVRYFDSGRWPDAADGGGSTLELRDARSDNASAEAWGASDETSKTSWKTYRWRGIALPGQQGEPDLWREFALGLVDGAGVVEVDDISVIEAPGTTAKQLISNGRFEGGSAARWRFLGNHRHSMVVPDRSEPGNHVLRVVSSGAAEYQGNQIECTLTNNLPIVNGREYEISFRARWRSGAHLLNARLYFNRLARTFALDRPDRVGTPGAPNSIQVDNLGPTYEALRHYPTVPESWQPVTVSVQARDPDGIAGLLLRYQVGSEGWKEVDLPPESGDRYQALIPGQRAGAVVQFYVVGRDQRGAQTTFPAAGPDSRALFTVRDSQAISSRLQQFRVIMTPSDATFLHTPTNTLSNELLGATVVSNEEESYYDVGVRLKGSFVGRNVPRVGFHVGFPAEQPFRGVHRVVSVDRSQHALTGGVGEIVAKHIATRAGGIPGMYDDIEQFLAPIPSYSVIAGIRLSGFDNDWLDSQYADGGDGSQFEVEVHRWNVATVDGKPESPKAVGNEGSGTGYANFEMEDFGDYADTYRWNYLQVNNRERDDYSRVIAAAKALGLTGPAFEAQAPRVLDVDAWLRVMAFQQLVGPADAYFTGGAVHNYRLYVRPEDQKVLYFPWDWDSSFMASADASVTGNGNIAKLLNNPNHRRAYLEHFHDLITTAFNPTYIERWTSHYGSLAQQNMADILSYIRTRSTTVLNQLPRTNAFRLTLNGGVGFTTNAPEIVLTGTAPITVRTIVINGQPALLSWTSPSAWRAVVGLTAGENRIELQALDRLGMPVTNTVAGLAITITNTGPGVVRPLIINEWMADNAGPAGVADPVDGAFQDWFELFNPNSVAVDISGYYLTDTPTVPNKWKVPVGTVVPGRGYLLVWADNQPQQNGQGAWGDLHAGFQLRGDGEFIGLVGPDGSTFRASIDFGRQLENVSQGRAEDDVGAALVFQEIPTPRGSNVGPRKLRIQGAEVRQGGVRLRWTSEPGETYRLEGTADLGASEWQPVAILVGAGNPELEFLDSDAAAAFRFYRVIRTE
ncbi:MAG: lamin tail domain-containing protein [Verrucomicrobiales bacterium]|nr:lamin tail domain-containing protein [Verrucomicrobiales bacterium]